MEVSYEIIAGKRRNSKLLYFPSEKQLYVKKSKKGEKEYYVCYKSDCKARVMVERNECSRIDGFINHNHPNQEDFYNELNVLNAIKKDCVDPDNIWSAPNTLCRIRDKFEAVCTG